MQQVLIRLAETPTRTAALTTGLLPAELLATPGPDEWSANDVLAHLRACSDVWGGHIAAILSEDMPTRRGVNPRTWIEKTDYLELEFQPSNASSRRFTPNKPKGWVIYDRRRHPHATMRANARTAVRRAAMAGNRVTGGRDVVAAVVQPLIQRLGG